MEKEKNLGRNQAQSGGGSSPLASGIVVLKAQNEGTASVLTAVHISIVDLLLFYKIIINKFKIIIWWLLLLLLLLST